MPLPRLLQHMECSLTDNSTHSAIVKQLCAHLPLLAVYKCSAKTWIIINDALRAKEAELFDAAIDNLCSYWKHLQFDDHPVLPRKVECVKPYQKYSDHGILERYSKASYKAIEDNEELKRIRQLLVFLCKHTVRTAYLLMFLRCQRKSCLHCSSRKVEATGVMELLRSAGGRLFSPTPSPTDPEHFMTFMECCFALKAGKNLHQLDEALPSRVPSRCKFGCMYLFASKRDEDRHYHLVHPAELRTQQRQTREEKKSASSSDVPTSQAKKNCHRCSFAGCGASFTTNYQLQQHKKREGHVMARGRPNKGPSGELST